MIIYTNQRSKKRKPNAKQRELQASWNKLLDKWAVPLGNQKTSKSIKRLTGYKLEIPEDRNPKKFPSVDTGGGVANWNKKDKVTQYTGDKMKGIGTLHKSNAVPVFTDDEAKDQANMRR